MVKRYSLEALKRLREQRVEEQAERVAEQLRQVAQAERQALEATAQRKQLEKQLADERSAEAERLARGEATVQDLALQAAWESQAAGRIENARLKERKLAEQLVAARKEEARRREELALREGEAKAVERHKENWQAEISRAEELALEEQAQEVWSARQRGRA
ncbi:MAG: hypothetical protein H6718_23870 [Polyangiaceae bacterium]|nr:hypothetical protein [Myxococcales bacterium]MCB9588467.1 hypothetical protein [Polyangiaceae bacterium]